MGLTCEAFRQQVKDRETNQPTDGHEGSWGKGKLQLQYDTFLNVFVVVVFQMQRKPRRRF